MVNHKIINTEFLGFSNICKTSQKKPVPIIPLVYLLNDNSASSNAI